MSWQSGQSGSGGAVPGFLAALAAGAPALQGMEAVRPFAEQAFRQAMEGLKAVPADIDWTAFAAGVERFRAQGGGMPRSAHPEIARAGRVGLMDAGGTGPVVVLVPSMVNRAYVLDLCPGHSLVEHLRAEGFRVLLVDWGAPGGAADAALTVERVVAERLVPLLRVAAEANGGAVGVFGYCMGGLLALAAAVLAGPGVVGRLALGAMPWDFGQTASARHMAMGRAMLEPWVGAQQAIPPEVMQQYFWMLDPWSAVRRLMVYGKETDPAKLAYLSALERWLWDGLPLDGPVAREILFDWYADNAPLRGEWRVAGEAVGPAKLAVPLWVAIPQRDVLVPPASSLPLLGQARGASVVTADTGHVGLVCGRRAKAQFYAPLAAWLKA